MHCLPERWWLFGRGSSDNAKDGTSGERDFLAAFLGGVGGDSEFRIPNSEFETLVLDAD